MPKYLGQSLGFWLSQPCTSQKTLGLGWAGKAFTPSALNYISLGCKAFASSTRGFYLFWFAQRY